MAVEWAAHWDKEVGEAQCMYNCFCSWMFIGAFYFNESIRMLPVQSLKESFLAKIIYCAEYFHKTGKW